MGKQKFLSKSGRGAIALAAISMFTALTGSETLAQSSLEDPSSGTETRRCRILAKDFDGVWLRVGCGCGWWLNDWAIHGAKIAKDIKPSEKDLKNPYDPRNPRIFSNYSGVERREARRDAIAKFKEASRLAWEKFEKCMKQCERDCEKSGRDSQNTFRAPAQGQETQTPKQDIFPAR